MNRNVWAKVYCDILRHPLFRSRPDSDVRLVLGLILYAKEHAQDGRLRRLNADELRGLFGIKAAVRHVQAGLDYLISVGWLQRDGEDLVIRDFGERQRRSGDTPEAHAERQRKYRESRKSDVTQSQKVTSPNIHPVTSLEPSRDGDRSDADVEEEEEETEEKQKAMSADAGASPTSLPEQPTPTQPQKPPAEEVFEHWKMVMGKNAATKFRKKRRSLVTARLAEGYTAEDLCRAIDGCFLDPFSMGDNDRIEKYNDLALICRDDIHVDKFIEKANEPQKGARPRGRFRPITGTADRFKDLDDDGEQLGLAKEAGGG